MYRVVLEMNDGPWKGAASCRGLRASEYFARAERPESSVFQGSGRRRARRRDHIAAIGPQLIRLSVPEGREVGEPEIVWLNTAAIVSVHPPTEYEVPAYDANGAVIGTTMYAPINLYWVTFRRHDRQEWGFAEPADVERILGISDP